MREKANKILHALNSRGFSAYLVGGCVRDLLLGKEPKDYDIVTNARTRQIKEIFPVHYLVGESFGIVKVNCDDSIFDVATYRSENAYTDGRRPDHIKFEDSPQADVIRRDFTINGLLMDINGAILDFVDGQMDLKNKLIRAIGNPADRFKEDYLRILRAIRFACRFEFKIEPKTWYEMMFNTAGLEKISQERISEELRGILKSNFPAEGIMMLVNCLAMQNIIPELYDLRDCEQPEEFHKHDVYNHTLEMLKNSWINSFELGMAILLHDIGKPLTKGFNNGKITFRGHADIGTEMSKQICARLKLSNEESDLICVWVKNHMKAHHALQMSLAKAKKLCQLPRFEEFLELHRLDILASAKNNYETYYYLKALYESGNDVIKPKPLINGDVLITLGFKPGPEFKLILNKIEEMQLNGELQTSGQAVDYVINLRK